MKLDETTITVLKNFQLINPSIQFNAGNVITTAAPTYNMLARAVVPVEFPRSFCVLELRRFLSVLGMLKEAELEFDETFLTFVEGKTRLRYSYCEPKAIVVPKKEPKKFPEDDLFFEFTLTSNVLKETIMGMNVLGHKAITISGDGERLSINSRSETNADRFAIDIGETDKTFSFIFEDSKLNFLQKDYTVSLSKRKYMYMEAEGIEYWVAAHKDSMLE